MAYPINIIINNRIWYDSRIVDSDPVVFQNVNYTTGDMRSVNIVRQRFMQDWTRRSVPNSVRQGIGLTDPAGGSDIIAVTQGYAVVGGRFLDIPAGSFDASVEGLSGSGGSPILHYLMIRVTPESEGDDRDPTLETSALVAIAVGSYGTFSHDDLVIAKFRYNGSVIDQFVDYTKEQEWQVNVISPPAARPGLSTAATDEVLLRAGSIERINILNVETDKVRFYLNAVFDDQTASTEVKLINNSGVMQITTTAEDALLGLDTLDVSTGAVTGVQRIDSSGNLVNIGDINARTMGGNDPTDLVDVDSSQTMTNKTLTSPTITGGAYSQPILDLPEINDTSDDHQYIFAVNELTGDRTVTLPLLTGNDTFVFEAHTQTLTNKTLTTPTIASIINTNTHTIPTAAGNDTFALLAEPQTLTNKTLGTLRILGDNGADTDYFDFDTPVLSANRTLTISTAVSDTFVFQNVIQTLTNKTLIIPTIGDLSNMTHVHTSDSGGGVLAAGAVTSGIFSVLRGGTGLGALTDHAVLLGSGTGNVTALTVPSQSKVMVSQTADDPIWYQPSVTLTSDVSGTGNMTSTGSISINTTVANDSHTHDTRYYTEDQLDDYLMRGSSHAAWIPCLYVGYTGDNSADYDAGTSDLGDERQLDGSILVGNNNNAYYFWAIPLPLHKNGKNLVITEVEFRQSQGNTGNYTTAIYIYWKSDDATEFITVTTNDNKGANRQNYNSSPLPKTFTTDDRIAWVRLLTSVDTPDNLEFEHVTVKAYYQT